MWYFGYFLYWTFADIKEWTCWDLFFNPTDVPLLVCMYSTCVSVLWSRMDRDLKHTDRGAVDGSTLYPSIKTRFFLQHLSGLPMSQSLLFSLKMKLICQGHWSHLSFPTHTAGTVVTTLAAGYFCKNNTSFKMRCCLFLKKKLQWAVRCCCFVWSQMTRLHL